MKFARLLLLLLLLIAACQPADPPALHCLDGVCISLSVEGPVRALRPARFTLTLRTERDMAGLSLFISGDENLSIVEIDDTPPGALETYRDLRSIDWTLDAQAGKDYTITGLVTLGQPRSSGGVFSYQLRVTASRPGAKPVTDTLTIRLDGAGLQVEGSQPAGTITPTRKLAGTARPPTRTPTGLFPTVTSLPTATQTPTYAYPPPSAETLPAYP